MSEEIYEDRRPTERAIEAFTSGPGPIQASAPASPGLARRGGGGGGIPHPAISVRTRHGGRTPCPLG